MLFASKFIESSGNRILNICDIDLVDKIIKDGETEIKISSNYYNENTIDEIEAEHLLEKCFLNELLNLFGLQIIKSYQNLQKNWILCPVLKNNRIK